MRLPTYILVSAIVFIFIIGVFVYSYIFYPAEHPMPCFIKKYSGKNCSSCGFSKAFSNYSHLQIKEGMQINSRSFPVLLFFMFQFLIRSTILLWFFTTHKIIASGLVKFDLIISISFFLLAFLPLLLINK